MVHVISHPPVLFFSLSLSFEKVLKFNKRKKKEKKHSFCESWRDSLLNRTLWIGVCACVCDIIGESEIVTVSVGMITYLCVFKCFNVSFR